MAHPRGTTREEGLFCRDQRALFGGYGRLCGVSNEYITNDEKEL